METTTTTTRTRPNWKFIIEKGPFRGYSQNIIDDGKIMGHENLTFEEYCALPHHAGKEFILVTWEELDELNANYREKLISTEWKEITEDQYDEALCVLPPFNWEGSYFQCMELYIMDLRSTYLRHKNKYYTALLPTGSPKKNAKYLDLLPG